MHILLATDGSPNGNAGGELLASLSPPPEVEVSVLVVVPERAVPGTHLAPPPGAGGESADIAIAIARQITSQLRERGYDAREEIRRGSPAQEIIDAATEAQPDFVMLGIRGVGRLRRLLAGSVATDVARRSTVPVLLTVEPVSFSRVVVVSDNSPRSVQTVEALRRIPPSMLSQVSFLLINQDGPVGEAAGQAFSDAARDLSEAGIDTNVLERRGNEVDAVLEVANAMAATLVIVAASGERVDGDPVLGTTAHGLLERAPCSLVIAR